MKITQIFRVEEGPLAGTEIEPCMMLMTVKYPHRKSRDAYIPPLVDDKKHLSYPWHCCQDCAEPDFYGDITVLIDHLMLHKGRLMKPWSKRAQLKAPIPAVRLPANPWSDKPKVGLNDDRRFCIELYIGDVQRALRRQGIEIIEPIPLKKSG